MRIFALVLLYQCYTVICNTVHSSHSPKLLLVSFDGFRWDYTEKTDTPNFDKIVKNGVKAKWIKDTYTSLTFPNHYTIVTGLYEESHGIIANQFYDPNFKEVFSNHNKTNVQDGKFWGGEPIWVTNQLQSGRSGVYWWVGSEAEIKGVRPTYYEEYFTHDASMEMWRNHTDTVMQWFTDKDKVVDLGLLYFKEPDRTGHVYGPDSPEVIAKIKECDDITGYILDQVEKYGLSEKLNIIITSDHGMAAMNRSTFVTLNEHIDKNKTEHLINYVIGTSVWPKEGYSEELYKNLSSMSDHVSVWWKKDIPPEYHYQNNPRVSPILLSAQEGWGISETPDYPWYLAGRHGFNNSKMDMHPFFVATGPVFKKGFISEPFANIHIYELMCHILGIKPAPNNGSLDAVKQLLAEEDSGINLISSNMVGVWIAVVIGLCVVVVLLVSVSKELYRTYQIKKKNQYYNVDVDFQELEDHEELLLTSGKL